MDGRNVYSHRLRRKKSGVGKHDEIRSDQIGERLSTYHFDFLKVGYVSCSNGLDADGVPVVFSLPNVCESQRHKFW